MRKFIGSIILESLQNEETRPHGYAHFRAGDDLCVILPGQAFWARVSDRSAWQDFIAYGETTVVDRRRLERIPTAVPDSVREALAAEADDDTDLPWGNPYCCEV